MSKVAEPVANGPARLSLPKTKRVRAARSQGFVATALRHFFRSWLNTAALVVFGLLALLSYSADWIVPNLLHQDRDRIDIELINQGFTPPVAPGVAGHILGTDEVGRDVLARLLYGGQVSLTIGFLVAAIAVSIGTLLGLLAGYFKGWVDDGVNLLVQTVLNVPPLFLLIMLSVLISPSVWSLSLLIGLLSWAGTARQVRGAVLSLSSRDYVEAARAVGASHRRILLKHMLPNVVSLMITVAGFDVVAAILIESGLSYLGFGISVPVPSWGSMLSDSQTRLTSAPWMVYTPAVAIFLTVLCVFLIADGLRDAFDPKLK